MGDKSHGALDGKTLAGIAGQIAALVDKGVQVGIVIGGGNIYRGLQAAAEGMDRVSADYMGMLATVINSLALQDGLEKQGLDTRVMSAIPMDRVAEPFIRRRAKRHLAKGRVVIFAAGTGNPFFSTDTAAALRALEVGADILMKGTKVDGLYTADPEVHADATLIRRTTFSEVLDKRLRVMDTTAVSHCMENDMPILVFNMQESGNIVRAIRGEVIGSLIADESYPARG